MRGQRMGMAAVAAMLGVAMAARGAPGSPITPYIDDQTVAVVRLDVTKIDTAAIQQTVERLFAEQHEPLPDETKQRMTMGAMVANGMLGRLKTLGGGQMYGLVAMPDVWPAMQPLAVLIPVGAGGDVAGMEAWVKALPLAGVIPNGDALVVKTLGGNTVFVGSAVAFKRLESLRAQGRPELEQRLAESTSALTIVATPTMDMRRVVAEMMPQLPAELGGASTQALAANLTDVTLEVSLPPAQEVVLTAHTGRSVETAQQLADMAKRGIDAVRRDLREFGPGGREAAKGPQVMAMLDALEPEVTGRPGDRVSAEETNHLMGQEIQAAATIRLSAQQLRTAEMLALPLVSQVREREARATSVSNLRQIAMACIMYANDKKQAWPGSVEDLKRYLGSGAVLTNPRDPQQRPYVLVGWTAADVKRLGEHSSEVPVAYEAGDAATVAVAFLDGHVEVEGRDVLQQQLDKAKGTGAK